MKTRCRFFISMMLLNFTVHTQAGDKAQLGSNYPYFNYDLYVTNNKNAIDIEVKASKKGDSSYLIKSYDDKTYMQEFKDFLDEDGTDALHNIWCDQFKNKMPKGTTYQLNADGHKVFSFIPMLDSDEEMASGEFKVDMEVSTESDQVLSYRMYSLKAFSPAFATKVYSYEYKADCFSLLPDRSALKELTIAIKGKSYFYPYDELMKRVYANYQISE